MRGIISVGGYVPFRRLQRSEIAKTFGSGGGKGTRSVASYDEDTTTMGVEAARLALRSAPGGTAPDRALVLHRVAGVPRQEQRVDAARGAATRHRRRRVRLRRRAAVGDRRPAHRARPVAAPCCVVTSDQRGGLPTSGDESATGDGAGALLIGDDANGPVIAEYLGGASTTEEFIERWRTPGSTRSRAWEERFGESQVRPARRAGLERGAEGDRRSPPTRSQRVIVTGMHARAARAISGRLGTAKEALVDDRATTVGNTGSAHAALLLADTLESRRNPVR